MSEEVCVLRAPQAEAWKQIVLDEIVFSEVGSLLGSPEATSIPLAGRLILVAEPNPHGGPARKKAGIVICSNFQAAHPDEFTASKTPCFCPHGCLCCLLIWVGQLNVGACRLHF